MLLAASFSKQKKLNMAEQKLQCNVSHASEFLSEPWTMLILREFMIFGGTRRFEQLYCALGISRNILSKRLRRLMELNLIKKTPIFKNSRRMEYKLRRKAWELSPVMLALHVWADRWSDESHETEIDFVDVFNNQPLAPAELRSQEGKILDPVEIKVIPNTDNAKDYLERYKTKSSRNDKDRISDTANSTRIEDTGSTRNKAIKENKKKIERIENKKSEEAA